MATYEIAITLTFHGAASARQVERWAQDAAEEMQERMMEHSDDNELQTPEIHVSRAKRCKPYPPNQ